MCVFFDPNKGQGCREPVAEPVNDKDRANFCGYFQAKQNAHPVGTQRSGASARAQLEALFNAGTTPAPNEKGSSTAEEARAALQNLFKK